MHNYTLIIYIYSLIFLNLISKGSFLDTPSNEFNSERITIFRLNENKIQKSSIIDLWIRQTESSLIEMMSHPNFRENDFSIQKDSNCKSYEIDSIEEKQFQNEKSLNFQKFTHDISSTSSFCELLSKEIIDKDSIILKNITMDKYFPTPLKTGYIPFQKGDILLETNNFLIQVARRNSTEFYDTFRNWNRSWQEFFKQNFWGSLGYFCAFIPISTSVNTNPIFRSLIILPIQDFSIKGFFKIEHSSFKTFANVFCASSTLSKQSFLTLYNSFPLANKLKSQDKFNYSPNLQRRSNSFHLNNQIPKNLILHEDAFSGYIDTVKNAFDDAIDYIQQYSIALALAIIVIIIFFLIVIIILVLFFIICYSCITCFFIIICYCNQQKLSKEKKRAKFLKLKSLKEKRLLQLEIQKEKERNSLDTELQLSKINDQIPIPYEATPIKVFHEMSIQHDSFEEDAISLQLLELENRSKILREISIQNDLDSINQTSLHERATSPLEEYTMILDSPFTPNIVQHSHQDPSTIKMENISINQSAIENNMNDISDRDIKSLIELQTLNTIKNSHSELKSVSLENTSDTSSQNEVELSPEIKNNSVSIEKQEISSHKDQNSQNETESANKPEISKDNEKLSENHSPLSTKSSQNKGLQPLNTSSIRPVSSQSLNSTNMERNEIQKELKSTIENKSYTKPNDKEATNLKPQLEKQISNDENKSLPKKQEQSISQTDKPSTAEISTNTFTDESKYKPQFMIVYPRIVDAPMSYSSLFMDEIPRKSNRSIVFSSNSNARLVSEFERAPIRNTQQNDDQLSQLSSESENNNHIRPDSILSIASSIIAESVPILPSVPISFGSIQPQIMAQYGPQMAQYIPQINHHESFPNVAQYPDHSGPVFQDVTTPPDSPRVLSSNKIVEDNYQQTNSTLNPNSQAYQQVNQKSNNNYPRENLSTMTVISSRSILSLNRSPPSGIKNLSMEARTPNAQVSSLSIEASPIVSMPPLNSNYYNAFHNSANPQNINHQYYSNEQYRNENVTLPQINNKQSFRSNEPVSPPLIPTPNMQYNIIESPYDIDRSSYPNDSNDKIPTILRSKSGRRYQVNVSNESNFASPKIRENGHDNRIETDKNFQYNKPQRYQNYKNNDYENRREYNDKIRTKRDEFENSKKIIDGHHYHQSRNAQDRKPYKYNHEEYPYHPYRSESEDENNRNSGRNKHTSRSEAIKYKKSKRDHHYSSSYSSDSEHEDKRFILPSSEDDYSDEENIKKYHNSKQKKRISSKKTKSEKPTISTHIQSSRDLNSSINFTPGMLYEPEIDDDDTPSLKHEPKLYPDHSQLNYDNENNSKSTNRSTRLNKSNRESIKNDKQKIESKRKNNLQKKMNNSSSFDESDDLSNYTPEISLKKPKDQKNSQDTTKSKPKEISNTTIKDSLKQSNNSIRSTKSTKSIKSIKSNHSKHSKPVEKSQNFIKSESEEISIQSEENLTTVITFRTQLKQLIEKSHKLPSLQTLRNMFDLQDDTLFLQVAIHQLQTMRKFKNFNFLSPKEAAVTPKYLSYMLNLYEEELKRLSENSDSSP